MYLSYFLAIWVINTIAIIITTYILPGTTIKNFWTAVVAALVLGLVNVFIRPFFVIISLPLSIITFGLFIFVINALMILLTSRFVKGFRVNNFGTALIFAVVLAIINGALYYLFG